MLTIRRLRLPATACGVALALYLTVAASAPSSADTIVVPDPFGTGLVVTVQNEPLALKGDDEACAPTQMYDPDLAHLSGPLTITLTHIPAGDADYYVSVGNVIAPGGDLGFVGSGFQDSGQVPAGQTDRSLTETVPASNQFRCLDGDNNRLSIHVLVMDDGSGDGYYAQIDTTVTLTNVD
jgi:hypothetical protein